MCIPCSEALAQVCNVLLNCLNFVWLCNIIKYDGHCIMRMKNSQCVLGCNQADATSTCAISCHGETAPTRAKAVQQDKQRAQWCKAFKQVLRESSTLKFTRPLCERADKLAQELILGYGRQKLEALQLDVVVGGGGWRGQYAGGAVSIFQALEKLQLRVVPRCSTAWPGRFKSSVRVFVSGVRVLWGHTLTGPVPLVTAGLSPVSSTVHSAAAALFTHLSAGSTAAVLHHPALDCTEIYTAESATKCIV